MTAPTSPPDGYPEILSQMMRHIAGGVSRQIGEEAAFAVAFAVAEHARGNWSGDQIYVPVMGADSVRQNLELFEAAAECSDDLPEAELTYGEMIRDLSRMLADQLRAHGMADIAARSAGPRLSRWMRHHFGGAKIYIPFGATYERVQECMAVWEKFKGNNQRALAREFGVSVVCIYRRIAQAREIELKRNQMQLF